MKLLISIFLLLATNQAFSQPEELTNRGTGGGGGGSFNSAVSAEGQAEAAAAIRSEYIEPLKERNREDEQIESTEDGEAEEKE